MAWYRLGGGLEVAHTPGGLSRPCRIPFGDRADGKSGYDRELDAALREGLGFVFGWRIWLNGPK